MKLRDYEWVNLFLWNCLNCYEELSGLGPSAPFHHYHTCVCSNWLNYNFFSKIRTSIVRFFFLYVCTKYNKYFKEDCLGLGQQANSTGVENKL